MKTNLNKKKRLGFTLMEMLIVIGIVSLTLPAVFAIIFSVIRQQMRVFALKQVKREGDFVLNSLENTIRNYAIGIHTNSELDDEVCDQLGIGQNPYTNNGNNFFFQDDFGNWFQYYLDSNVLSSQSATLLPTGLTTSLVRITNFSIACNRLSTYSAPLISISFDISYIVSSFPESMATLHYQTQVQMRTF